MHTTAPYPTQGYTAGRHPADKDVGVAYLLWFFLGPLGVHQFYLGNVFKGVTYFFTAGWFLIGWFIDLFTLPAQVRATNYRNRIHYSGRY